MDFARRLRSGHISARQVTEVYLARIAALNPVLDAYIHVAADQALETADALDRLLSSGTDLGPLMGVPVAVKDLFAVSRMPTRAGSNIDLTDCIGSEGIFIHSLRRAGCVILGKTRTIEFAAGAQNLIHPTPWNPCDMDTHRTPGGSSNGSAVAVAAGLCGFAIGSDTGGSVRQPAALCGVVGLKTSHGIWPTDGVFPLCPLMDTVGLLAVNAQDASVAYAALTGGTAAPAIELTGVRLGVPRPGCMETMDADVADRYESSLLLLEAAGARLVPVSWPTEQEQQDIKTIFAGMVPADLLNTLGRERFQDHRHEIDPVAVRRLEGAWALPTTEYIRLKRMQERLAALIHDRMQGLDGIVGPTAPLTPRPVREVSGSVSIASAFVARSLSYTRAANVYDMCAITIPISDQARGLPVGLQITCRAKEETKLLSLANAISPVIST
jgi:aspartyl-tRNA(Asn)/glutamyl-tRNA(Gln) amidotransferase subunit A